MRKRPPSLLELETMFPSRDPVIHAQIMGAAAGIDKAPHGADTKRAFFKPPLGWSLVARDWNGGFPLFGELGVATDKIRLTKSTRVLLGRVHAGDGPVAAFLQLGIGEWRYDPDLYPFSTRRRELALQFGGGIAVLVSKHVAFAWEVNHLTLCRDPLEPPIAPTPYIVGTLGVVDIRL